MNEPFKVQKERLSERQLSLDQGRQGLLVQEFFNKLKQENISHVSGLRRRSWAIILNVSFFVFLSFLM